MRGSRERLTDVQRSADDDVVPNKLFADGAEGRLREEGGAELVTLDHVDFGLFDGAASMMEGEQTVSGPH